MEKEHEITIERNEIAISAMFSLFHVIYQMERDYVTFYCHDKKAIINLKKDSVPIKLDYKSIEEKELLKIGFNFNRSRFGILRNGF